MPIHVDASQVFTRAELENALRDSGDTRPRATIKRLEAAGLRVRHGKFILGAELLSIMADDPNSADPTTTLSAPIGASTKEGHKRILHKRDKRSA